MIEALKMASTHFHVLKIFLMKDPERCSLFRHALHFNSRIQFFNLLLHNEQPQAFTGGMRMKAFIEFKDVFMVLLKVNPQSIIRNLQNNILVV